MVRCCSLQVVVQQAKELPKVSQWQCQWQLEGPGMPVGQLPAVCISTSDTLKS